MTVNQKMTFGLRFPKHYLFVIHRAKRNENTLVSNKDMINISSKLILWIHTWEVCALSPCGRSVVHCDGPLICHVALWKSLVSPRSGEARIPIFSCLGNHRRLRFSFDLLSSLSGCMDVRRTGATFRELLRWFCQMKLSVSLCKVERVCWAPACDWDIARCATHLPYNNT